MFFKNVLVPYDESEHARSALHIALGMVGEDADATIHLVTIVPTGALSTAALTGGGFDDPFAASDFAEYDSILGSILHRARSDMEGLIEDARDEAACTIKANAIVAPSPVEGIAEYVSSHDIDLVIMGRRGLGALRGMLGSVSFGVLRSVEVPVLTVK